MMRFDAFPVAEKDAGIFYSILKNTYLWRK